MAQSRICSQLLDSRGARLYLDLDQRSACLNPVLWARRDVAPGSNPQPTPSPRCEHNDQGSRSETQVWVCAEDGTIRSVATGLFLTLDKSLSLPGTSVVVRPRAAAGVDEACQKWEIDNLGFLRSARRGLVLDSRGNIEPGAPLVCHASRCPPSPPSPSGSPRSRRSRRRSTSHYSSLAVAVPAGRVVEHGLEAPALAGGGRAGAERALRRRDSPPP